MIRADDARRAAEAQWLASSAAATASATEENDRWLTLGIEMGAAADAMTDLDGELEQVSLGYRFLRLSVAHLAADVSHIALLTLRD